MAGLVEQLSSSNAQVRTWINIDETYVQIVKVRHNNVVIIKAGANSTVRNFMVRRCNAIHLQPFTASTDAYWCIIDKLLEILNSFDQKNIS
mmetsp:Transcript_31619/g.46050  ORF Transcript_31619/g.46050 Transcript_31619/m.46050 type:complete len:91 (-) Transcript_31619:1346-1618(-)